MGQYIDYLFDQLPSNLRVDAVDANTSTPSTASQTVKNDTETGDQSINTEGLIGDLALILVIGAISTLIFKKLKQPVVLGYIVAGFITGPHFGYFSTVTNEANIEFWAQIGIVVLLFSLGLEFSFKKLMNVGGSAVVTALIIVLGMMGLGFGVGKMLDFSFINALFLGAMLSMSSTTIIIKAFTDLNMRQRKFVPMVFAVLICEDLFAVIMMVILSSIAINNTLEGMELLYSILKLIFFLVIWFTVGVFVLPSFFRYFQKLINEELLLIISMGLCFLMAIFSVYSGFSLALGAFVMGSILAGTCEAEHIEKVTKPVKDLFGAVFFISVGMMVNPSIIVDYAGPILLLSVVVILGMITFGTFGMLVSGQTLKIAMESGFSLTQIGEFAFIIATLGMSLGVLEPTLYPIIIAVSVITTFFTPYFIKLAVPAYNWVEVRLPERFRFLINRYSKEAASASESKILWKDITLKYLWRIILYSVLITAIMGSSKVYFFPFMIELIPDFGKAIATIVTLFAVAPFLLALANSGVTATQKAKLYSIYGASYKVPLVVMTLLRILIAFGFIIGFLIHIYSHKIGISIGFSIFIIFIIMLSSTLRKRLSHIESRFVQNLNERELRRSGKDNNLISDLHVAYMEVGYQCPFVGERLGNSNVRKNFGVNVVSIQRGRQIIPIPKSDTRIFPGDILGVIGNDEQIQRLLSLVEDTDKGEQAYDNIDVKFTHFEVKGTSPIIGKTTAEIHLRDKYSALLVAIQRDENNFIKPDGHEIFLVGDILWIVGDEKRIALLK